MLDRQKKSVKTRQALMRVTPASRWNRSSDAYDAVIAAHVHEVAVNPPPAYRYKRSDYRHLSALLVTAEAGRIHKPLAKSKRVWIARDKNGASAFVVTKTDTRALHLFFGRAKNGRGAGYDRAARRIAREVIARPTRF